MRIEKAHLGGLQHELFRTISQEHRWVTPWPKRPSKRGNSDRNMVRPKQAPTAIKAAARQRPALKARRTTTLVPCQADFSASRRRLSRLWFPYTTYPSTLPSRTSGNLFAVSWRGIPADSLETAIVALERYQMIAEAGAACTRWERAYQDFETPEQEIRKFTTRLRQIGAHRWAPESRVLEICSGRGSGLRAWHALGFTNVIGVDLSFPLVAAHTGPGVCVLGDARALPLASASRDIAVVQGGLHHLSTAEDVSLALAEMRRNVAPNGRIIIVEPWATPFLSLVHWVSRRPTVRRLSSKVDAFAIMVEEERVTYNRWLRAPEECLGIIHRYVQAQVVQQRWGKLTVVGTPARLIEPPMKYADD